MLRRAICKSETDELGRYAALMDRIDKTVAEKRLFLTELTLKELAKEVGTNRTYLCNALRERNTGFYDYINSFRLDYFHQLVAAQEMDNVSLTELAEKSGFNTTKLLNRYLKRQYGLTASHYRHRLKAK
ncbi:MAG: helix-turn-helix domain-containing protein [Bacteroidales bacterium]|nr:helix-turn-helix domain-containing protein [Bacteroidales bacterium]